MARVLLVFLAVLAAGLALGAQLTYSAAETAYRDAIATRLRMIGLQLANTIQTSQSLGIALEAQDTLPALVRREAAGVPDLVAIEIAGPSGAVLFASAPAPAGGETVVVPVLNDLGQQTGAVRLLRDATSEAVRLEALRSGLMARAVPIGLGVLAAAGLVLAAVARRRPGPAASSGADRVTTPGPDS